MVDHAARLPTAASPARSPACACSSSRRSWPGRPAGMMLADMGADVDQGREAARRRRLARLSRAARQRRVGAVPDAEPQQARHRAQPEAPAGRDDAAAHGARRRRADRELPPRHAGEARVWATTCCARSNPGLIYCAISGYGRDGPYADKGGFDLIAQGFAGLMSITGEPGRTAGQDRQSGGRHQRRHPARRWASLAAYVHKLKTGRGPARRHLAAWKRRCSRPTGRRRSISRPARSPGPTGSAHLLTAPYQAFRASDGWINIGGANQANWERIAEVLGHPGVARRSALRDQLGAHGATCDALVVADERRARDAHARPSGSPRSTPPACRSARCTRSARRSRHPQTLARDMVVDLVHPQAGADEGARAARSTSRTRRRESRVPRRCWASTRAKCCASTAMPTPRSTRFVAAGVVESASGQ